MMIVIAGLFCIILLLFWELQRFKADEPPRLSRGLPIIGHAHLLIGDTKHLWDVFKQFSEECITSQHARTLVLGVRKFYVLTDPDDCLTVANSCPQKDIVYDFAKPVFGDGLVTSSGMRSVFIIFITVPAWKRHRKILNPVFSQKHMIDFLGVFNEQARNLAKKLQTEAGESAFNHDPYIRHFAMEAICATALGNNIIKNSSWNSSYRNASENCLKTLSERVQKVWLYSDFFWNFSSLKKTQDLQMKKLHSVSNMIVQNRKKTLNMNEYNNIDYTGKPFKPFLDLIFELNESYGEEIFSYQQIREHVDTFIVAGHDTVSVTLIYSLLLIGSYPDVQRKTYDEIKQVFKDSDRDVTKEDLPRLVYLEAVLKETMRMYPSVPVISRTIEKDIKLKNHILRSGNSCILMINGVHMHPMWGKNVKEFVPERWLDPLTLPANPNFYIPFSLGKRVCIGRTYAIFFIKTVLSHVLRHYSVSGDHRQMVNEFDIILKPIKGHFISLQHRKKTNKQQYFRTS